MELAFALYFAATSYFAFSLLLALGVLPFYRTFGTWDEGNGVEMAIQSAFVFLSLFLFIGCLLFFSFSPLLALVLASVVAVVFPVRSGWKLRRQLQVSESGPRSWAISTFPQLSHPWVVVRPMLTFDCITIGVAAFWVLFFTLSALD
jgi:hypothetical protein